MIGEGSAREFKTLGGETAFKPLPKKTPTRMIVLWSVLVVGVGLLVAMALSLLKRVRPARPANWLTGRLGNRPDERSRSGIPSYRFAGWPSWPVSQLAN